MQEQFSIRREDEFDSESASLALLLGGEYFTYAIHDTDGNAVKELKRFPIQQLNSQKLNVVLQNNEVLQRRFQRIVTAFDFDTYSLLPVDLNKGDNTALLYMNGAGQQDHIITEVISRWGIANVYSIPYSLLNWTVSNFPSSKFWHVQSVLIKNISKNLEAGCLNVDFGDKKFIITATHEEKLLISKSYFYKAPADVLFYLLKICESFDLKQEEVQVNLTGLIDKESGMFRTLYEYFLNVNFLPATWDQPGDYPSHYFTLLNQISRCEL